MRPTSLLLTLMLLLGGSGLARADGDPPAVDEDEVLLLIDQLASREFDVRERAMARLVAIGQPAVPLLKEHVDDEDLEVRWRVRKILVKLGALVPKRIIEEVRKLMAIAVDETKPLRARQAAEQQVVARGAHGLAALFHMLVSDDYRIRRQITEMAKAFRANRQVVPLLLKALEDEDNFVRSGARRSLMELTGQEYPSYAKKKWHGWWKAQKGKPWPPKKEKEGTDKEDGGEKEKEKK